MTPRESVAPRPRSGGDFHAELRKLYEQAGAPTAAALIRQAPMWKPPLRPPAPQTVSDWLTGKSLPASQNAVCFLITYLSQRAQEKSGFVRHPMKWWLALHAQARTARRRAPELRPADTDYLHRVRQIAPRELVGRSAELAELKRFCTAESGPAYLFWQAAAWAGKSALLSTFVLQPPGGTTVVSFFITGRWASQNTREDFIAVVIDQLLSLIGTPVDNTVPDARRDGQLLRLLAEAAQMCQRREHRLVLVVDGLDEDQGKHSIAALLPVDPPGGIRVVVGGRAHPPLPDAVPDHHPLRMPDTIRRLPPSPVAEIVRADAMLALRNLLDSAEGRDILGLIITGRGGLTRKDLVDLTGASALTIETTVNGPGGRALTKRPGDWTTGSEREVYLLAHEKLQDKAADAFTMADRVRFQDAFVQWANDHRDRQWPPDTPGYLLRDYPRMLRDHGDLGQLGACATDLIRHDRMFAVSGSDAAALAEIAMAQDAVARSSEPDLLLLVKLARHRHMIRRRTYRLPPELPAAWAKVGETTRAEAMTSAIAFADTRAEALESLSVALAWRGDIEHAERLAAGIAQPTRRLHALNAVADAWTAAGRPAEAARLAHEIWSLNYTTGQHTNDDRYRTAATNLKKRLAEIMRAIDGTDHITELARVSADKSDVYLRDLVQVLTRQGNHEEATELDAAIATKLPSDPSQDLHFFPQPHGLSGLIGNADGKLDVLCYLIPLLSEANRRDQARIAIDVAKPLIAQHAEILQNLVARRLAYVTADAGEITRARDIIRGSFLEYGLELDARCILAAAWHGNTEARDSLIARYEAISLDPDEPGPAPRILAVIAGAVASSGEPERARILAVRAEEAARRPAGARDDFVWATGTARALALIGHPAAAGALRRAREFLDGLVEGAGKSLHSRLLVEAAIWAGDHDWAYDLWRAEGRIGHHHTVPLVEALTAAGKFDFAVAVAQQIGWASSAEARTVIINAFARSGDLDQAEALSERWNPDLAGGGTDLTRALLAAGHVDRAEAIARRHEPIRVTGSLMLVAEALAAAGSTARARDVAQLVIDNLPSPTVEQLGHLPDLIRALHFTDNTEAAGSLADFAIAYLREADVDTWYTGSWGVLPWRAPLAVTLAAVGEADRSEAIAKGVGPYADTLVWTNLVATPTPSYRKHRERWHAVAHATALSLIRQFDSPPDFSIRAKPEWVTAVQHMAVALAQAGDHERAVTLADAVKYDHNRHQIRTALGAAAAASGDLDRAEQLIAELSGTDDDSAIKFDVAEAVIRRARTAPPAEARQLVARAWRLGLWPMLFDGLAYVDRSIVAELAAEPRS